MKKKKIKFKNNFFMSNFKESYDYLFESRYFVYGVTIFFFLFAFIVFFGFQNSDINNTIIEYMKNVVLKFEGLNTLETIGLIFLNNSWVSFLGIFLGIFLGVMPVIFLMANSYILGFVLQKSFELNGALSLLLVLPHGIFEIPAILVSFGLGIRFGMFIFSKKPFEEIYVRFVKNLKCFLFIVVPLLVIAAIIEGILISIIG